MSIRFAPAFGGYHRTILRGWCRSALREAANDNRRETAAVLPVAALRHFAAYGLASATQARTHAEEALGAGERGELAHWIAIWRQFDRPGARAFETRIHQRT